MANNSMTDMDVTHQRTYRYGADALVPFGAGKSLTQFELSFAADGHNNPYNMSAEDAASSIILTVHVMNTGRLAGDEVVQLYLLPKRVALARHPLKTLIGFVCALDVPRRSIAMAPSSLRPSHARLLSFCLPACARDAEGLWLHIYPICRHALAAS